jgi:hypothetical protein
MIFFMFVTLLFVHPTTNYASWTMGASHSIQPATTLLLAKARRFLQPVDKCRVPNSPPQSLTALAVCDGAP